jgi:hypothetical protein
LFLNRFQIQRPYNSRLQCWITFFLTQ